MRAAARVLLAVALTALAGEIDASFLQARRLTASLASPAGAAAPGPKLQDPGLQADLDRIFTDPVLSRALVGVRVESLRDGQMLYAHDDTKLVMPASNMKLLTMAVAAERLGLGFHVRNAPRGRGRSG